MSAELEVRAAADRLVAAFGDGRLDDYFACFHPECSFVFYTIGQRLESVAAYRTAWNDWVAELGLAILGCLTSETRIQVWDGVGVLTHSVETRQRAGGEETTIHERETIVFARQPDGSWLGVHEHLSPAPPTD